MFSVDAMWM